MHQFADALRQAGANLGQQDQSLVSGFVKQAADGLESVSRVVADKQPDEMLRAVRDFGRANPVTMIAASVLAGVALGRLARASGEHVRAAKGEGGLASGSILGSAADVGAMQPGALSEGLETAKPGVAAQPVPAHTALADTESIGVLGDGGGLDGDDTDFADGPPASPRDEQEV
jgi:hypothetical protein